ncbi:UNVERIFIED_CONTAM: Imidazoleglycerol-phosphate dehydratase, chloroplastic [Sesamum calycinum]|uniref:Imidazoleglycerol-phosphate dehydratase, chloroplastic n=1 Tax=Sesamum calycinum TaxID=2727403 RepID=A0AAW2QZJ5_9LAMI
MGDVLTWVLFFVMLIAIIVMLVFQCVCNGELVMLHMCHSTCMLKAVGIIISDDYYRTEDVGVAMGTALLQAVGDRKEISLYGDFSAPHDEALVQVSLYRVSLLRYKLIDDEPLFVDIFRFCNHSTRSLFFRGSQ